MFIKILRDKLTVEKRDKFTGLVFAKWVVVTLLLILFMKEDTWGVLDLLAPFGPFCGLATFFILNGPVERGPGVFHDLEGGQSQHTQATPQPTLTSHVIQVLPEDEADGILAEATPYIRNDHPFSMGSDSPPGDVGYIINYNHETYDV